MALTPLPIMNLGAGFMGSHALLANLSLSPRYAIIYQKIKPFLENLLMEIKEGEKEPDGCQLSS